MALHTGRHQQQSVEEQTVLNDYLRPPNLDALLNGAVAPIPSGKASQSEIGHWFDAPLADGQSWLHRVLMETPLAVTRKAEPEDEPPMLLEGEMPSLLNPPDFWTPVGPQSHGLLACHTLPPEAGRLLKALQDLPVVSPLTTVVRCPRGATRRFAQLYASAFLFHHLSLDCSPQRVQLFTLLLYHLPMLLLYDYRVQEQPEAETAEVPPTVRKCILDRLAAAESGNWIQLVEDLHVVSQRATSRQASAERRGLSSMRRFELAYAKAAGRCYRAATDLMVQDTCPPESMETSAKVKSLFVVDRSLHEQQQFLIQLDKARKLAAQEHIAVQPRLVSKRLSSIRPAAQPGLSRSRNSHLSTLLHVPIGVQALTCWCEDWANGRVTHEVAEVWLQGHVKALGKPESSPITLFEAPYTLATGVMLDMKRKDIAKVLQPHQFGAMLSCGAEQATLLARTLVADAPPDSLVFFGTDLKNAFGNVPRKFVLEAVAEFCPLWLPLILASWQTNQTTLWVPVGLGESDNFGVVDGVFQGECLSSALFCLILKLVIRHFYRTLAANHVPLSDAEATHVIAYIDDCMLVVPKHYAPLAWKLMDRHAHKVWLYGCLQ